MMQRTIGWKLEELDRILNDPTTPMEAHRVWSLLDDLSESFGAEEPSFSTSAEPLSGAP
jgi:hypothetical protein